MSKKIAVIITILLALLYLGGLIFADLHFGIISGIKKKTEELKEKVEKEREKKNNLPHTPSNPSPGDGTVNQSVNVNLAWTGGDPDPGDSIVYDVYFGTAASPPQVSNDQSATTYNPPTLSYGTQYFWKIVSTDKYNKSTAGPVWRFTTQAGPGLTLTSPNGGEVWVVGTSQDITWASTGAIANVKLEYSKDDFTNVTTIIDSTPNDGSYSWNIPDDPSTTVKVRVSDAATPGVNDVSNANFEIQTASSLIIDSTPNDGSHPWNIPLKVPRWLCAAPDSSGKISLSWRLDDHLNRAGYNVYRSITSGSGYTKVNSRLVTTTSFVDNNVTNDQKYYYVVRAVNKSSIESSNSNEASTTATATSSKFGVALTINLSQGSIENPFNQEAWGGLMVGDLNADGNIDYFAAGWDSATKKTRIFKAFNHQGNLMWENSHYNSAGKCHYWSGPVAIWDIDKDGQNEVITDYYENNKWYMAIMEGSTGNIKTKIELQGRPYRAFQVADFRGLGYPQDIFVTINHIGKGDNEVDNGATVYAYKYQAGTLSELWRYKCASGGEMTHLIKAGDVDYDGRDEVMTGEVLLRYDGAVRWKRDMPSSHTDSLVIAELDGDTSNGQEIIRGAEGNHINYIDALDKNGVVKWSRTDFSGHCHRLFVSEIREDYPGKELSFCNVYLSHDQYLLSKSGDWILKPINVGDQEGMAILWTGDDTEEIYGTLRIVDGHGNIVHVRNVRGFESNCVADLTGDYREEYVGLDHGLTGDILTIRTNTDYNSKSRYSRWEDSKYLQNMISRWIW